MHFLGDNGTVSTTMVMPRHRWGHVSAFIGIYVLFLDKAAFLSQPPFLLFDVSSYVFLSFSKFLILGFTLYICGGSTELAGNIAPNDTCDTFDAGSK